MRVKDPISAPEHQYLSTDSTSELLYQPLVRAGRATSPAIYPVSLSRALGAQPSLDIVVPGFIYVRPICSHGLENRGPEAQIGGAVGFTFDRRQVGLARQGLGREQLGNFTKP